MSTENAWKYSLKFFTGISETPNRGNSICTADEDVAANVPSLVETNAKDGFNIDDSMKTQRPYSSSISILDMSNQSLNENNEADNEIGQGKEQPFLDKNASSRLHSLEKSVVNIQSNLNSLICEFEKQKFEFSKSINKGTNNSANDTDLISAFQNLLEENKNLKEENKILKERVDNLGFVLADLNTKLKLAVEEKCSLVTAIRLLHQDAGLEHTSPSVKNVSNNPDQNVDSIDYQHVPQLRSILGVNKLSVLNDEVTNNIDFTKDDTNEDQVAQCLTNPHKSNNRTAFPKQRSGEVVNASKSAKPKNKKTVVIAKDSIVKNVVGTKLSNNDADHFYVVKSFPGTTLADMNDFVKPLVRRKPNKLILNAGTNDLKHSSPRTFAESIVDLAIKFKEESPNTNVGISTLLVRSDNIDLSTKVKQVNSI